MFLSLKLSDEFLETIFEIKVTFNNFDVQVVDFLWTD